ncbi:MAG: hypothetical protein CMO34_05385 [Verrucomicrobia bacterium]|nr:hypothetical protein [Verrucomicrobiota bacterium]
MEYLQLILGLVALIAGGEFLVRASIKLALRLKISALVIGMTVVSFGTSAPELLVSLEAALSGHPDVSIGAVIGSNISNLGLVLGITVIIFPIAVNKDSIKVDWPLMMLASILFYFFALDEQLVFYEGLVLFSILVLFTSWLMLRSRKEGLIVSAVQEVSEQKDNAPVWKDILVLLLGLIGLYFGAEWLIESVVIIARNFDISEKFISVSIVAFGTSLPELVTSTVAAFRKETDISIGNLVGSNVFNILAILGITSMVHPISVNPGINSFDVYYMLGISAILLPLMLLKRKLNASKGAILLVLYLIYIGIVVSIEL